MSWASEHNRKAWDALVREEQRFTRPAPDSDFQNPLAAVDGCGWLGESIAGRRVLCLASGGGRQSALYAAAGGIVTVVDICTEMLALERQVAAGARQRASRAGHARVLASLGTNRRRALPGRVRNRRPDRTAARRPRRRGRQLCPPQPLGRGVCAHQSSPYRASEQRRVASRE